MALRARAGYAKDEIEVRVGEAGTEVAVACARKDAFTVDAAVGRLRVAHRQVVEGFRRVFDVPPGADVDDMVFSGQRIPRMWMTWFSPRRRKSGGRCDLGRASRPCGDVH